MGVLRILFLLQHFLTVVFFYGAQFALSVATSSASPFAVSKNAVDGHFAKAALSSKISFFGVDGSVLIHSCLRRCMTDVVINDDFTSFKSEIRNTLVRLQLQIIKYAGAFTNNEIFLVFDGHRIPGKLVNETRSASRAAAAMKIASEIANASTACNYSGAPPELSKKDLNSAVGGYAIQATKYVQELCVEMGISFSFAPAEAEHQLIYFQQMGMLKAIFANDSDYILLGGENIILDSKRSCFSHGCKIWAGPSVMKDARLLKQLIDGSSRIDLENCDQSETDTFYSSQQVAIESTIKTTPNEVSSKNKKTKKSDVISSKKKKTKKSEASLDLSLQWSSIIMAHGFKSLEFMRCWLKSDYNSFPNVGMKRVLDCYYKIILSHETDGNAIALLTTADMFQKMAVLLHPFVFRDSIDVTTPDKDQVFSLVKQMEKAWIMYTYSVVASVDGRGTDGITHMNPFVQSEFDQCIRHHSVEEMKNLVGLDFFKDIDVSLWTKGFYDISTGKRISPADAPRADAPLVDAPLADAQPAPADAPPSDAVQEQNSSSDANITDNSTGCGVEMSDNNFNSSPKYCSHKAPATTDDGFPSLDLIPKMIGTVLREWLKKCGVPIPTNESRVVFLRELLYHHIVLSQQHGISIFSSTPTKVEKQAWGEKVTSAHAILKVNIWTSCQHAAKDTVPSLPDSVIADYEARVNVSSSRVKKISETRFSDHCQFFVQAAKRVVVGLTTWVPVFVRVDVARSSTEEDRTVLLELLVDETGNRTINVNSCICLPPNGLLDVTGNIINSKIAEGYKPCRSGDGRCSHIMTGLNFFASGGKNHSTTRGLAYWLRTSNLARDDVKRFDKNLPIQEPFFAEKSNRSDWIPFRDIYAYGIKIGLENNVYLAPLQRMCEIKRNAIADYGNPVLKGRPLRIETGYDLDGRFKKNRENEEANRTERLRIQAGLKERFNLTHVLPLPAHRMDVTAATQEPPPLAPLAITTVQGIQVVGATSVVVAGRTSTAHAAAYTQNFGKRRKCNSTRTGRNLQSIENDEHTDSKVIAKPAPKKMTYCRNCACGAADHSGILETDFVKTKDRNTMNQWAKGLKVVLPEHLPLKLYVHFSHFSVEDFSSLVTDKSVCLRRGAEPSLESRSIFATKEDLKVHLKSLPVNGKDDSQNPKMCICYLGDACKYISTDVGFHYLPKKLKAKKKWIHILCPCITVEEMSKLLELTDGNGAYVDRRHFSIASLKVPITVGGRIRLRNNALPTRKHVPIAHQYNFCAAAAPVSVKLGRKEILLRKGKFRKMLFNGGINPVLQLVENLVMVTNSESSIPAATTGNFFSKKKKMDEVPHSMQNSGNYSGNSEDTMPTQVTKTAVIQVTKTAVRTKNITGNYFSKKKMDEVPHSMQNSGNYSGNSEDTMPTQITKTAVTQVTKTAVRTKNIVQDMQKNPDYCQSMTGEPSFAVLEAIWKWIDADGAFSTMHLDRIAHRKIPTVGTFNFAKMTIAQLTVEKNRVSRLVEEHKHSDLKPFEQFILFMVLYHRGVDGFVDTIALDFQISSGTARRYYDAFMCGLSFFSMYMQPNPTCEEMVNATPSEVSELINTNAVQGTHGVVMADCTERKVQAPGLCAFFHFLFSAYKNRCTVKHLTVTSGNGLLHLVGTFAPTDDADCIRILGVAQRLGQALRFLNDKTTSAKKYMLSFVYDKGLDSYSEFVRNMIRVVMPDKKQNHQQVFKKDSSEKDTKVAKVRNLIENINADLKQYRGFDRELPLSRIDMAAHEINVARFLVNLKPEFRSKDLEPVHERRPELDRVQDIAHEPGCITCKCQACTAFKSTYNKVVFRGADDLYSKSK